MPSPRSADSATQSIAALTQAIPSQARRLLHVGCGAGRLGALLKQLDPQRTVFGVEVDPNAVAQAREVLDDVFLLKSRAQIPSLEPRSSDCIVFDEVLERWINPWETFRRYCSLLSSEGILLCRIANVQQHSLLGALLTGDFQYQPTGLLDKRHLRFFSWSTVYKLLLDCGFVPTIVQRDVLPPPQEWMKALEPLLRHLGLHIARARIHLETVHYLIRGDRFRQESSTEAEEKPFTFVVPVSDEEVLHANFLSSPCIQGNSPHQVLLVRNCTSAAQAMEQGRRQAKHEWILYAHQDVYLPRGWTQAFSQQLQLAESTLGPLGMVGVYGTVMRDHRFLRVGHVVDRERVLNESLALPAEVDTLDELLLAFPKDVPLKADPSLGFHLYGADLCLQARQKGFKAVAVDALCLHCSKTVEIPPAFVKSARILASKWRFATPLATSCALIDPEGRVLPPGG